MKDLKTKMISLIILMTVFSGCFNVPLLGDPVEVSRVFLKEVPLSDQERLDLNVRSVYEVSCFCSIFEVTPENIGETQKYVECEIHNCNKTIAFKQKKGWAEFIGWFTELMVAYNQASNNLSKEEMQEISDKMNQR